jgi:pimeloyl-ACP methyl ester carboxylesterase
VILDISGYETGLIATNNVRLHVVQAGPADGPLVVLLHGFPEYWYSWRNQIGPLAAAGFRVVIPDQRGYNLSDKPAGAAGYTLPQLTADVTGLLDALGREKCFLAGHDWGAAVAWEMALQYPQRIEKLAILNVPHLDVMRRFVLGSSKQMRKSWYIFLFQLPGLPEWMLGRDNFANLRRMMKGSGRRGANPTFSHADLEEYAGAWGQPGALTGALNWYRAVFRQSLHQPLNPDKIVPRRVTVPTLMLWGKNDVALSAEMAQPSIDLCDQGRLVFYENATHWVQHDEAEAVTGELVAFFSRSA